MPKCDFNAVAKRLGSQKNFAFILQIGFKFDRILILSRKVGYPF